MNTEWNVDNSWLYNADENHGKNPNKRATNFTAERKQPELVIVALEDAMKKIEKMYGVKQ